MPKLSRKKHMHESDARLNYSFGEITIKVGVDGNVDRPYQAIDHMLATATAVTGIEAIQLGIVDGQRGEGKLEEKCAASIQIGEIKVSVDLSFDFNRHVSKRTLNSLVFSAILPKVWQTAGLYFGDGQTLTTPQAPLAQMPRQDVSQRIDEVLGLATPAGFDFSGQQTATGQARPRQLVSN